ncbi:MAG: Cd(II)/Pb(II)-responsive transcriptional regulator [Pseudomonadales bacterium]|nr:Cd(II)/Pb(II)-responsive transcriptional regulator [Halioglobus sp.]MCP5129973.1 Cd(II)/Pb(II)-responsive transcriptional regulator [Pseudomonadales bacterium]
MKIGELAKLTGCSVQTIRYYEKEQLLASGHRSEGNFRLYDQSAVEQLLFIKHCRCLDLALAEIHQLLELKRSPSIQCDDINRMIESHIQQVEQRIEELNKLRQQLRSLHDSCSSNRTIEQCGILQNLSTTRPVAP